MTPQSRPTPEDSPDDAFGEPARSLAVPDPFWPADAPSEGAASLYAGVEADSVTSSGGLGLSAGAPDARAPWGDSAGDVQEPQFSHAGLTAIDPWAPRRPWYYAIWPWGMGGVIETLDVVVLALVMFMGVRFMAHNYIVDGASMVPTFEDSDFLIVNRLVYRSFDLSWIPGVDIDEWRPFGEPEAGDVIVFHFEPSSAERDFIKRVVAVPGQTVEVRGGAVYVDGVRLDEPYIAQPPNYELPPTVVEPGTFFVLGDNRNNSFDSHIFGVVDESTIVGRADLRYWPVPRWGLVEHMIGNGDQFAGRAVKGLASIWP